MNMNYFPNCEYEGIEKDDTPEVIKLKHRVNDLVLQFMFEEQLRRENPALNDVWEKYISIRKLIAAKYD